MKMTTTAFGTWSGGRYMHFGEQLSEEALGGLMRQAYDQGIRTFVTADVYGVGKADELLGQALAGVDRDSYCLIGTVGHDIYDGVRQGSKGYPRFTDPSLRGPEGYAGYLRMATEKSLERCRVSRFDAVMLHNPDSIGYTSPAVWDAMEGLRGAGLTEQIGVAPGPANGFVMDLIHNFETFGDRIDLAMVILNPLEPWPQRHVLPVAERQGIEILTRVVDYGGVFHGGVRPGHKFRDGDHRSYRPAGWVEHAWEKVGRFQEIADRHGLSLLQFACQWNLAQPAVTSVVPTLIQEAGPDAKDIRDQIRELAAVTREVVLTPDEIAEINRLGDNEGCMALKGASERFPAEAEPEADAWPVRPELLEVATRFGLNPAW
jgi:aryl-alcohol dehydrogenase-like predicted oxidoreductase